MAAWTEAQRVSVRKWLGFGNQFIQADPRLEIALDAILALADGGVRPDNSAQLAIIGYLTQLDGQPGPGQPPTSSSIEGQWLAQLQMLAVGEADGETKLDALRALTGIARIGRFYVRQICFSLGFQKPLVDVFASNPVFNEAIMRTPENW